MSPRTQELEKKIEKSNFKFSDQVSFLDPFGFSDYCFLQMNSRCVLSDSGTITEESSILNFPVLNLRVSHERPEGLEEGAVMSVGLSIDKIINALHVIKNQSRGEKRDLRGVKILSVNNVSEKLVRIILGNVDLVNQNVWHKEVSNKSLKNYMNIGIFTEYFEHDNNSAGRQMSDLVRELSKTMILLMFSHFTDIQKALLLMIIKI